MTGSWRSWRPSSAPYVSGDTFRSLAHVVIDESSSVFGARDLMPGSVVFCKPEMADRALKLARRNSLAASHSVLIVHNSDAVPAPDAELWGEFGACFTVNATREHEARGIRALPIGLENQHHMGVGFLPMFQKLMEVPRREPDIEVLASFRVSTNPDIRTAWRAWALSGNAVWREPDGDVMDYWALVRRSKFVLSPPGNGRDCHRTWEALYLGATPVIAADSLAPSLASSLPIAVVTGEGPGDDGWVMPTQADDVASPAYLAYWADVIGAVCASLL